MGPVANVIGLPSVKKLKKVPPIAPATTEVPGAKVRDPVGDGAVKESVPVAEKKPLMESAWATAALPTAMAVNTTRRLSMVGLREQFEVRETFLALSFRRCPPKLRWLATSKKYNDSFLSQYKAFPPNEHVDIYHDTVQSFA